MLSKVVSWSAVATAKAMVLFVVIVLITGIQLFTMKRKEVEAWEV